MRQFSTLLAALALVAAACGSGTSTESGPTTATEATTPTTGSGSTTSTATSATDPESTTTTTTEPEGISNPELQAAIDELVVITEDIRGLEFTEEPKVVFVTEDELDQRLLDDLEEEFEPEELARDEAAYVLLGILEEGRDLRQLYLDLYANVVAGFYDPEEKELVVPVTDGALTGSQRRTLVHELTHALTDQAFDFGSLSEQLADEERYEEALALRGVVEGDASITEALYLQTLSSAEQRDALSSEGLDPNALAGVPRYIQDLLFFPYTAGVEFMVDIWRDDGFAAVNAAYRNPPITTEQVLDPDAYRSGEAGVVVMVEELSFDGYELGEEGVWGETGLGAMLGQNLVGSLVQDAADGWGGDWYQIYFDGENVLFVFSYVGDSEGDAEELVRAIDAYNDTAIAGDDFHFVEQTGDRVLWILADDPAVGALAQERLAG